MANANDFLESQKNAMESSGLTNAPFLRQFETVDLHLGQLKKFGTQWYLTARGHKQAFPALIHNITDDDIRFDLIDILNEEYGNGDRKMIHARLLERFLMAMGLTRSSVESMDTIPEVTEFISEVENIWKNGDEAKAFGLHFALEYLAASLHTKFANGLEKYSQFQPGDIAYFTLHREREPEHADFSEAGFLKMANDEINHSGLRDGVNKAIELMNQLWSGFDRHVFAT